MEIVLKRIAMKPTYTIGKLYINGKYECDTIEDKDRGLTDNEPLSVIQANKVYGQTAIPYGKYKVSVSYSNHFKKDLPLLHNVKAFEGIRIHSGNTADDSLGCILLGENKEVGKVLNSRIITTRVVAIIKRAYLNGEHITIEIKK